MRRMAVITTTSCALLVGAAAPALAAVPPHDHWLTTGSGDVVHVGPDVCDNPDI